MHVTKGTKIVSFDKEAIEKAGYDVTVPVVVSNSNLFKSIEAQDPSICKLALG